MGCSPISEAAIRHRTTYTSKCAGCEVVGRHIDHIPCILPDQQAAREIRACAVGEVLRGEEAAEHDMVRYMVRDNLDGGRFSIER